MEKKGIYHTSVTALSLTDPEFRRVVKLTHWGNAGNFIDRGIKLVSKEGRRKLIIVSDCLPGNAPTEETMNQK